MTMARARWDSIARNAQHVLERKGQVGALVGRLALRDHPEPAEAQRVVDADAAGMVEPGAQCGDEGIEAGAPSAPPARSR